MSKKSVVHLVAIGLLTFVFVAVLVSIGRAEISDDNDQPGAYVLNELLIGLKAEATQRFVSEARASSNSVSITSLDRLNEKHGVSMVTQVFAGVNINDPLVNQNGLAGVIKLTFSQGKDIFTVMEEYAMDPSVEYVELNRIYKLSETPSDEKFSQQWALHNDGQTGGLADADIDAPEAWNIEQGNSDVLIAIIDTGVDYTHQELSGGRIRTDLDRDFVNGDEDAMDDHGHGTYVSGIAAANTNNDLGMAGICHFCEILPVKVLDSEGSGTSDQVAQGIQYAAEAGAQILSMSLGYPSECGCSETVARAINYAYERGSFLVAASGNDSDKQRISYPAASSRVFAVGASDHIDAEADFSNRVPGMDIMAPGKDVLSLDLNNDYRVASGTSAATPHVAGVAGLLLSHNAAMTNKQLWVALYRSADDFPAAPEPTETFHPFGPSEQMDFHVYFPVSVKIRNTFGRLNAYRALTTSYFGAGAKVVDSCNGEPTCVPGCGAETSLAGHKDSLTLLHGLRDFRDQVLRQRSIGQHWIILYEANRVELAALLAFNSELRQQTREAIDLWFPLIDTLVNSNDSETVILSSIHLDAAEALVTSYESSASSQLSATLDEARELIVQGREFVGLDVRDAWKRLNE